MKKEDHKKITALGVVIFSFIAVLICVGVVIAVDIITALLVLKTPISESILMLGSVVGSSLGTVFSSLFLTVKGKVKGIVAAAIIAASVIAVKAVGNAVMGMGGYFSWTGLIGILFVIVFALVGGAVGASLKK